jgi:hypothetical protein
MKNSRERERKKKKYATPKLAYFCQELRETGMQNIKAFVGYSLLGHSLTTDSPDSIVNSWKRHLSSFEVASTKR